MLIINIPSTGNRFTKQIDQCKSINTTHQLNLPINDRFTVFICSSEISTENCIAHSIHSTQSNFSLLSVQFLIVYNISGSSIFLDSNNVKVEALDDELFFLNFLCNSFYITFNGIEVEFRKKALYNYCYSFFLYGIFILTSRSSTQNSRFSAEMIYSRFSLLKF